MKITCDKCDAQIELDQDPGQIKATTCRCTHCNAILKIPMASVETMDDAAPEPKTPLSFHEPLFEKADFLRTDMPGKKRQKKKISESSGNSPVQGNGTSKKQVDPWGTVVREENSVSSKPVAGERLDQDDPFDFLADDEEKSLAGDMFNEKTEVLDIDDFELNPRDALIGEKADPGRGEPPEERDLFLDFDLDGLGLDGDVIRRIDKAENSGDGDDMKLFTLDLEEEFSAVSEDETIVFDLDLDGRSERFPFPGKKMPVESLSAGATGDRSGFSSAGEPAAVSSGLDGRFGAASTDGLLDLFLDFEPGRKSTASRSTAFPEEAGMLEVKVPNFIIDEDDENLPSDLQSLKRELDARDARDGQRDFLELDLGLEGHDDPSSSEDVGLGLDENLLLDLDFEDEDLAGVESPESASGDPELEQDESLLLDLDLDFGDIEGDELVSPDRGEVMLEGESVAAPASGDEDLLDDLDLDFEDDEQISAMIMTDGGLNRDSGEVSASEAANLILDEDLFLDLDLDDEEKMAAAEEAALEGDSAGTKFDLDNEKPQSVASTPNFREDDFTLELDLDDGLETAVRSDADDETPALDLDLPPESDGEIASVEAMREDDFTLELDLDDGLETAVPSDVGDETPALDLDPKPVSQSDITLPSGGGEEDSLLELDLDDGSEEPLSDGETEAFRMDSEKMSSLKEDPSLVLSLDDAEDIVSGTGTDPAEASTTEPDEVLKAVDADTHSDEDFLFNMELEKLEESPDTLEAATVLEHVEVEDGAEPDGKSIFHHEPERFEMVEEILLSADHELKTEESEHQDKDFIDAFDMGIPTNEFKDLEENQLERQTVQNIAGPALNGGAFITTDESLGRGRRKISVWILMLALVGVLLFGAYSFGFFDGANVSSIIQQIPFLKDYVGEAANPGGKVVALVNTIQERFVENKVAGTLLVITGKVRNDSLEFQSHIGVIGTLSAPDEKNAAKEAVYCGNTLTDEELATLPPDRIKAILAQQAGKDNSNVNVPPGKVVPYMIVFDDPPATPEALSVMVKESMPSAG